MNHHISNLGRQFTAIALASLAISAHAAEPSSLQLGFRSAEATMTFDPDLIAGLNLVDYEASTAPPASVTHVRNNKGRLESVTWHSSLASPQMQLNTNNFRFEFTSPRIPVAGSWRISPQADDLTTTGGQLLLSNLTIDTAHKVVLADVSGANGLAAQSQLAVFAMPTAPRIDEQHLCLDTQPFCEINVKVSVDGLLLTPTGLMVFEQGFGLLSVGSTVFGRASSPIPEASIAMLTALGLLGIALQQRLVARRPA